jgi:hypothetical protein
MVRTTRKKQRGGAPVPVIGEATRAAAWREELERRGLTGTFPHLVDPQRPKADKAELLTEYIAAIQKYDDLMDAALYIIRKKLKEANIFKSIDTTTNEVRLESNQDIGNAIPAIEARREELLAYFSDVHRIINFVDPKPLTGRIDKEAVSKLEMMLFSRFESFYEFLMFPARVLNIFQRRLALIMQDVVRTKSDILERIASTKEAAGRKGLIKTLAEQWRALVFRDAYNDTSRDLRDGFYVDQRIGEIHTILARFFEALIDELLRLRTATTTDSLFTTPAFSAIENKDADGNAIFANEANYLAATKDCARNIKYMPWGVIAAHIMTVYRLKGLAGLDEILPTIAAAGLCGPGAIEPGDARDHTFDPEFDTVEFSLAGSKVRLSVLLSSMDDSQLQFILQVSEWLRRVAAAPPTKQESGA